MWRGMIDGPQPRKLELFQISSGVLVHVAFFDSFRFRTGCPVVCHEMGRKVLKPALHIYSNKVKHGKQIADNLCLSLFQTSSPSMPLPSMQPPRTVTLIIGYAMTSKENGKSSTTIETNIFTDPSTAVP